MDSQIKRNIVFMGIKHCGKSTIGRSWAQWINWDFFDLDDMIEQEFDQNSKLTVRQIFDQRGEDEFRALEAISSAKLALSMIRQGKMVVSLGGSTIENPVAMGALAKYGFLVYLEEKPETLIQRVEAKGYPPYVDQENPREHFLELIEKRGQLYKQKADLTLPVMGKSVQAVIIILEKELEVRGYGWK